MSVLPDLDGRLRPSASSRDLGVRENDFFEITLHVLAVSAGYRPRIPVPGWGKDRTTKRSPLKDRILRIGGINPDDPTTFPQTSRGRAYPALDGKNSLYSVLDWGPQYTQGNVTDKFGRLPIVVRGEKCGGPKGSWALTEAGVAIAARAHNHYRIQPGTSNPHLTNRNVTCIWLDAQMREHALRDRLIDTLKSMQQIRKEVESGEISDHVDHWFALVIHRDGLRTRLETYDPPPFRQMKEWCLRALWTTLRGRAQDADTRMAYGAMTEKERTSGGPQAVAMVSSSFARVVQKNDDTDEVHEDLVDTAAHTTVQHQTDFRIGMGLIDQALQQVRPGNADRLARIFSRMAEGHNVQQLADEEGVSRNRMASLLGAVRGALRDARQISDDMWLVLDYLQENPWSTREDIAKDLQGQVADVDATLDLLQVKDRVASQAFKGGTGYTITDEAVKFLSGRTDPRSQAVHQDPLGSLLL